MSLQAALSPLQASGGVRRVEKPVLPEGPADSLTASSIPHQTLGCLKHIYGPVLPADHPVFKQQPVPLAAIQAPGLGLTVAGAVGPGGLHTWNPKGSGKRHQLLLLLASFFGPCEAFLLVCAYD